MDKEFTPYVEALELKELGFDKPCFGWYQSSRLKKEYHPLKNSGSQSYMRKEDCNAPTFSQAFRFIREKYWYTALILCDSFQIVMQLSTSKTLDSKTWEWKPIYITQTYHKEEGLKSYDESELACLKQLIEMVKMKQK